MIVKNKEIRKKIKKSLLNKLKTEHAFWSYDNKTVTIDNIDDDNLIAMVMRYLDLQEIEDLQTIFPLKKIKQAWRDILVPEGDYLYTMNRFFCMVLFQGKKSGRLSQIS